MKALAIAVAAVPALYLIAIGVMAAPKAAFLTACWWRGRTAA